jgi:tRNA(adenine34) deaminase
MTEDEKWMKIAIREAIKAQDEGEVPVGAILVKDGLLIAAGHNQCISFNDPSAHAEIQVLRKAGKKLKNYRLNGISLYVTLEPCAMCLGAIMHARIERIIYGANDLKTGVCGSCENLTSAKFFNHVIKVNGGILEKNCKKLLQNFFKSRRLTK